MAKFKSPANTNLFRDTLPWTVRHKADHSDIEAYITETDKWEVIATITSSAKFTHTELSDFLVRVVNQYEPMRGMLREAHAAFTIAIDEGWHSTAELAADKFIGKVQNMI